MRRARRDYSSPWMGAAWPRPGWIVAATPHYTADLSAFPTPREPSRPHSRRWSRSCARGVGLTADAHRYQLAAHVRSERNWSRAPGNPAARGPSFLSRVNNGRNAASEKRPEIYIQSPLPAQ